jgi:hypothetical protein
VAIAEVREELGVVEPWKKFYYGGFGYAMEVGGGRYIPLPFESQVCAHLEQMGITDSAERRACLCQIREHNYVLWIGPVAGYKSGLHISPDAQGKILVTQSPVIIKAAEGQCKLISRILKGLFVDPEHPLQFGAVMGWLYQARKNVVEGRRRPLPALALVGPIESGKSLFLEIVRLSLGGRSAPAFRALVNQNGFNSEILGAELLTVDDEVASADRRARVRFGQAIKLSLFGPALRIEGKGRDAFSARPVHALAIALNDDPQHVQVLPELDHTNVDKISLIRTGRANLIPGEADNRDRFMERIRAEIPAFLYRLEQLTIPEELENPRTGCAAWQHPDILEMLTEIAPETRLWELIQQCPLLRPTEEDGVWRLRATAVEIEQKLKECSATSSSAKTLLYWNGAMGAYLAKLADSGRYGVSRGGQRHGIQTWIIPLPNPDA